MEERADWEDAILDCWEAFFSLLSGSLCVELIEAMSQVSLEACTARSYDTTGCAQQLEDVMTCFTWKKEKNQADFSLYAL